MKISIPLPSNVNCLLKVGQNVDFHTPFYKKTLKSQKEFHIASILNIAPKKIFSYLTKLVGEKIAKNEIIAKKKDILHNMTISSDVDGIIKEIDHIEGIIIVEIEEENFVQNCFFRGIVSSLDKSSADVEIKNPKSFDLKNADRDFGGPVFYIKEKILPNTIKSNFVANAVIICESLNSFYQTKIEALGGKGFVTLKKIADETNLGVAQLKLIDDLKIIFSNNFECCLIIEKSGKIFFYN